MMTKQDFIALADAIRDHNARWRVIMPIENAVTQFTEDQLKTLADFCRQQNSAFMRERWLGYIAGENGKNGGQVKR
jgi:hypothetical protein